MERRCRAQRHNRRWLRRAHPDGPAGSSAAPESGLTLIELVIAMSVFAILAGGVAQVAGSGLGLARNSRDRSIAANLASEDIDAVTQMPYDDLAATVDTATNTAQVVGGVSYTVNRAVSWRNINATTNICDYNPGGSQQNWVVGVTTTVTWPAMTSSAMAARSTTIVSPPVGNAPDANTGTVPVTVQDANGNPVSGISVLIDDGGAHSYSGVTDNKGCAFLLVAPSTYTLSLSTAQYVDRLGDPNPEYVFSISKGGNVPKTFEYDHGGSLTITASSPGGAAPPPNVPITLFNQNFPPPNNTKIVSAATLPGTITNLFPDAYRYWSGDCADADPESSSWTDGARDAPASVISNTTASASVSMGTVEVSVLQSGAPLAGATVSAVHDSSGGACAIGSLATSGYALGSTDVTGALEATLPWGHWKLVVTPPVGAPGQQTVVVDPTVSPAIFTAAVSL